MEDLIYYTGGVPSGVIAPSTVFNYQGEEVVINGPAGISRASLNDEDGFHQALIDAGSLIKGLPEEVSGVVDLLADPITSRTVSYLLCFAKNCRDVIEDVKSLNTAKVMIVGCGGIGSSLCMLLAGVGIRNFCLVDADVIEKSNLNRQFFWTLKDVGQKKVHVLKHSLEARFEGVSIECLDTASEMDRLCEMAAGGYEGVAITADNPPTLARDGWKLAKTCGIPVVSGGYLHHLCASFHFEPHDYQAVEEAAKLVENERWSALPSAIMPSYGPMNLSLAAVLSSNLISSMAKCSFGIQKTSTARWDSRAV
ncbi:ThiF family adenylyltransferase [Pseudomonas orientalis]|uniref:ThiF family adenylyltransferase n=1 Tax=Pseudomonas orientalis TaxID=76758 RepID=UPI00398675EF